ncbi:RHS repeat-associated core domain-containing protein [Nonomuraea sp. NPDC049158]|uniref:RHS repeat-associated core domain-containing protein n=1 Tax=Nonomuraea sp. NPDC049158 TaxID=3155649 RepID=UPI0033EF3BD8
MRIQTFDHATAQRLGGVGTAVRATRSDGAGDPGFITVAVDYSGFKDAHGGGFASRLALFPQPACALEKTPSPQCLKRARAMWRPVPVGNDVKTGTLTAAIIAAPVKGMAEADTVYVVSSTPAATADDGTGSFAATDLNPAGTWTVGLSAGDFTYSYPLRMPPSPSGFVPEVSLNYSSSSIDGLTSNSNNQAGAVGLGWSLTGTGFIEQRYKRCDLHSFGSHPCNAGDITLSVGGRSVTVVKDTGTGGWKTTPDLGWKIQQIATGAPSGLPFWQITTQEGTSYRFGYRRDASWQFGYIEPDEGEPCYDKYEAYDDLRAFCTAPYRWMLDRETDPKGNVVDYSYTVEQNSYCIFAGSSSCGQVSDNVVRYDRGGYLAEIAYGSNIHVSGSAPTGRLVFAMTDRPLQGQFGRPDDLICPEVKCGNSPSFFTTRWLNTITTQAWNPAAAWSDVSRLELARIPELGWIDSIRQVGLAGNGPDIPLPPARFTGVELANRVGYDEDFYGEYRLLRIAAVDNGMGGRIEVRYTQPTGCPDPENLSFERSRTAATYDCFWVYEGLNPVGVPPNESYEHVGSVYNKWLVAQVVEKDLVGGSPDMWTRYRYLGGSAFVRGRYDRTVGYDRNDCWESGGEWYCFSGLTWVEHRDSLGCSDPVGILSCWGGEWTDYRGYRTVEVTKGYTTANDPQRLSITRSTFYRGLYGEQLVDGPQPDQTVTDFDGNTVNDDNRLAGETAQEQTFRATSTAEPIYQCAYPAWDSNRFSYPAGARVSHKNQQWEASRSAYGEPGVDAVWTLLGACPNSGREPAGLAEEASSRQDYRIEQTGTSASGHDHPYRALAVRQVEREKVSSGWRYVTSATTYNADGLPTKINDYGETGNAADNTCTSTTYARNAADGAWMISYPAVTERRTGDDCTAGAFLGKQVTLYDSATSETGNTPTRGNTTETRTYASPTDYTSVKATFDSYGRETSGTDPLGKTVTTVYNPPTGHPINGVTATNPLGHATTTWTSYEHGAVVGLRDANGNDVNIDYDALSRTTTLWTALQPKSGGTPAASAVYQIPADSAGKVTGPARTTISRLVSGNGTSAKYLTTYSYDDGFGRSRETQAPSPAGGRIVSVTTYDARGFTAATSGAVHNTAQPGAGLLNPALTSLPQWSTSVYDGLGRATAQIDMSTTTELRRSTTTYFGDRTETTPPVGGKTVSHVDAGDRVTKAEEWVDSATHYDTRYEYDIDGRLTKQIDANGNVRTFTYDLRGQRIAATDPDAGSSSQGYDAAGRLAWTVDGNGTKVSFSYDDLGRKTAIWQGEPRTGTKLAEWVYDTLAKGQLTSATRFHNGNAYVDRVTGYDSLGRPTGSVLSVPEAEDALAGDYQFSVNYHPGGGVATYTMPAAGGLPKETLTTTLTDQGLVNGLTSDWDGGFTYVKSTGYSPTGRLIERQYGATGQVKRNLTWDAKTGWLSQMNTTVKSDTSSPQVVQDDRYTYDLAGQITRILDAASAVPGQTAGQSECFNYDGLYRLTGAWTTTKDSCASGTSDSLGLDPYNQSYKYDAVGNITSVTDKGQTSTYTYPVPGASAVRPNAVTSINRPNETNSYRYDNAGQLTNRTVGGVNGTFTWNALGQVEQATIDGKSTSNVYDADGERLIRRDPDGTTLYLGSMELRLVNGQVMGTRYYEAGDGSQVATRASGTLSWMAAGLHGSNQMSIDDTTGQVRRQRYFPFGDQRGRDELPFTDLGFLGKTEDASTDLVYLSARFYDAGIGKFISADALLDLRRPQWANPYSYAGNNPIGYSDPTGLAPTCDTQAECDNNAQAECERKKNKVKCAQDQLAREKAEAERYWQQFMDALFDLAKIAADELGITAGIKCFTTGDLSACGDTALNILGSLVGGLAGKLAVKYAPPWKWSKAVKIGKKILDKGGRATRALDRYLDSKKRVQAAEKNVQQAVKECNSFVPGTQVLMADGTRKPIEQVKISDRVLATDPRTGRTTPETVLATISSQGSKQLVEITVDTDGNRGKETGTVTATAEHLFWVVGREYWANAANLHRGVKLRDVTGDAVPVLAVRFLSKNTLIHNLAVENVRTYHVAAGEREILVHNCPPGADKADEAAAAARRADERFAAKNSLNADSDIVQNRTMTVSNFMANFRKGSIKSVMPSEYLEMTVEEALKAAKAGKDTTLRKLLTDKRFKK